MRRAAYEPYLERREWSPSELALVGFFDDGLSPEQLGAVINDLRWVTPTNHLGPEGIVLVATGAFSPFHAGHLRMLDIAKRTLEDQGKTVAGAYIHPDHDGYVSRKANGTAACPAPVRIHLAQQTTKEIPWLAVDPWNALYQKRDLNYTTVLRRTENYLRQFGDYQIVFVCGSDNSSFRATFAPGEMVCVGRPGLPDAHPDAIDMSSTRLRAAGMAPVDEPDPGTPYLIRGDLAWATAQWPASPESITHFMEDLTAAFRAIWPTPPVVLSVEKQAEHLRRLAIPHVSFDRVTGSEHWVSRVFDACTHQEAPTRWLSSNLAAIPKGEFALIDDDIASGATIRHIIEHTPQVKWTRTIGMADWIQPRPWFDVVDARDFLFGSRCGGLWVEEDAGGVRRLFRAPYLAPWVNLAQRARIGPAAQPAFIRAVLRANLRFFSATPLYVADMENADFWGRLGYSPSTPMPQVCAELLAWNPN